VSSDWYSALTAATEKRALEEAGTCDRAAVDEVLLDDPLQRLGRAVTVPGALGVDDRDRPVGADAQAVGLGAQHAAGLGQPELAQPSFQELPGFERAVPVAAGGNRLVAAEQDVAASGRYAGRGGGADDGVVVGWVVVGHGRYRR